MQLINSLGRHAGAGIDLAYSGFDTSSAATATEMQTNFQSAGWQVRNVERLAFRTRAGFYICVAGDTASPTAERVATALHDAGAEAQVMLGFRNYARARRAADPNWQGITMTDNDNQAFVLLVGRQ